MWKLKKRERYALIEQDIEAPRKHRGTFYIGPRHVKHHSTKEFVEFSYVTSPNFASEKDCRVFAQNSHVAVEIYDFYVKLFDPDYENVSVYDERFDVQYLFKEPDTWRSVDYYNPTIQVIPLEDGVEIKRIFDTDYGTQTVEISHIVKTGARLKHNVVFTNKTTDEKTFRVVMKLAGITSNKVKQRDGEERITTEKHIISPFLFIGEDNQHLKLTEYLWSLGITPEEPDGEWTATTLKDIVFDVHAQGCKCDVVIGNYTLGLNESLLIDPDSHTWQIDIGANDGHCCSGGDFDKVGARIRLGYLSFPTQYKHCHGWFRWTGISISGSITHAYVYTYCKLTAGTPELKIHGVHEDNPDAPLNKAEFDADPLTDGVDWDGAWIVDDWNKSSDIKTIMQTLVDAYTIDDDAIMLQIKNDIGAVESKNWPRAVEGNTGQYAAKLEVTWEAEAPPTGWRKLQYFTEPPTGGAFNPLKFASEPPVSGAYNKLLYEGE